MLSLGVLYVIAVVAVAVARGLAYAIPVSIASMLVFNYARTLEVADTRAVLTADGETEVVVVMPELVVRGWRRLLHNQKALYVKRLLLFEPRVILASVPYQLLR